MWSLTLMESRVKRSSFLCIFVSTKMSIFDIDCQHDWLNAHCAKCVWLINNFNRKMQYVNNSNETCYKCVVHFLLSLSYELNLLLCTIHVCVCNVHRDHLVKSIWSNKLWFNSIVDCIRSIFRWNLFFVVTEQRPIWFQMEANTFNQASNLQLNKIEHNNENHHRNKWL